MAEAKKVDESKPVRRKVVARNPISVQGRGIVWPGSVIEMTVGQAAQTDKRGWTEESKADLNLVFPDDVATQLGQKSGGKEK